MAGRSLKTRLGIATMIGSELGLVTAMFAAQKGFSDGFAAIGLDDGCRGREGEGNARGRGTRKRKSRCARRRGTERRVTRFRLVISLGSMPRSRMFG